MALSSTTGAIDGRAPVCSALAGSAMAVAIQRVAKLLAMMATSAAAQAPQAKAKSRFRQGPGSTRSSQRKAAIEQRHRQHGETEPDEEPLGAGLLADQRQDDQTAQREQVKSAAEPRTPCCCQKLPRGR